MERNSLLLLVTVVAVFISVVSFYVAYNSVGLFNNFFTGLVTENGTVILTIDTRAEIKIISANGTDGSKSLNWGSGVFDAGESSALLVSNGTVSGGNWPNITKGFVVENVGNLNVSLNISVVDDAPIFLGGTNPLFQYNITNIEANSCVFHTGMDNTWKNFTKTPVGVCSNFRFMDISDSIRIDILLKIPNDGKTGELTNTVVLTYEAL